MFSDIADNELGYHQHIFLKNVRLGKDFQWEYMKGYRHLWDGGTTYTNIRNAIEINDEFSGDRFILFQNDTNLYRLDYDEGDGNGYENETPQLLNLPSGVTINDRVRFNVFRGVIRITGGSEPLWYGYIKREILENSIERQVERDTFNSGVEGWTGSNANVSTSTTQRISGSSLYIQQTAADGMAKKSYSVEVGKKYRYSGTIFKPSGESGDVKIALGSTDGGTDYGEITIYRSTSADQWKTFHVEFTATAATLYVSVNPGYGASADTCYVEEIFLLDEYE